MHEYVFFNRNAAERFIEAVERHGVRNALRVTEAGGQICLGLEEAAMTEAIEAELDALYDELLGESDFLGGEDSLEKDLAGFEVELSDGTCVTVPIPPETMKKLTAALTLEEIRTLLASVARAVETRDARPLCHFDETNGH